MAVATTGRWLGGRPNYGYRLIDTGLRYLGRQVAGRQRSHDELVDARDPALGTLSRQRWQEPTAWAWSEEECWTPLVTEDLWQRVKAMFGATDKNKAHYRCAATRPDYSAPSVPGQPPTYSIREERILTAVDDWLATITDPDHLDATLEAILAADRAIDPEPAEVTRARRQRQQFGTELDRMLAAVRAGMDPELAARETRKIQADLTTADAVIERWNGRPGERPR